MKKTQKEEKVGIILQELAQVINIDWYYADTYKNAIRKALEKIDNTDD